MRSLALLTIAVLTSACSRNDPASLCQRFFSPYPDLVSGRARTTSNATLLDAMTQYSAKDYPKAIEGLQRVLDEDAGNMTARMYMANAQLASGEPYKAEMHLDFMENQQGRDYADQVEWYDALCWLCEGDTAKAAQQARWIASRPHTYSEQAKELAETLSKK